MFRPSSGTCLMVCLLIGSVLLLALVEQNGGLVRADEHMSTSTAKPLPDDKGDPEDDDDEGGNEDDDEDSDEGDDEDYDEDPIAENSTSTTSMPALSHHHHFHVHAKPKSKLTTTLPSTTSPPATTTTTTAPSTTTAAVVSKESRTSLDETLDQETKDAMDTTSAPVESDGSRSGPSTTSSPDAQATSGKLTTMKPEEDDPDEEQDNTDDYSEEGEYRTTVRPGCTNQTKTSELLSTRPKLTTMGPAMNKTVFATTRPPAPKNHAITIKPLTTTTGPTAAAGGDGDNEGQDGGDDGGEVEPPLSD